MSTTYNAGTVTDLELWCENDGTLYRHSRLPVTLVLQRRWRAGTYDEARAIVAMRRVVDAGARLYLREFGGDAGRWHDVFTVADRNEVARRMCAALVDEWQLGNFTTK
jgi:hypothetical protein